MSYYYDGNNLSFAFPRAVIVAMMYHERKGSIKTK